jgi:hypothetical protein
VDDVRIVVTRNTLPDLANDMTGIATTAKPKLAVVVRRNAIEGNALARKISDSKAGIHGLTFSERIKPEMITPLSWEYGPTGSPKSEFVGVGFRHGVNTDLPQSADVIGPKFARDVGETAQGFFW